MCLTSSAERGASLLPPPAASPRAVGFQRIEPVASGLTFIHSVPASRSLTNQMLLDGAGVALADVDRDGNLDVFLAACCGASQLWRNEGGWRFREVTKSTFPELTTAISGDVTGAAFADLNGDRAPDLVLNTHADGIRVLLNDGHGVFRRLEFPQVSSRGGHSLALADVDGDGWVDLYVCNYRQRALMDMPSARATFQGTGAARRVATLDGRLTTDPDLTNRFVVTAVGGLEELGEPDALYRNFGGTNFTEVPWIGGAFVDAENRPLTDPPRDWGLAAQVCDVNDDGRPDLYVCNDFQTPDRLWLNESTPGQVRFRLAPPAILRHTSLFSMGVDFADVNRDGRWDAVVLDMLSPDHVRRLTMLDGTSSVAVNAAEPLARPQSDANTFFLQRRDGSFAEVAAFMGVTATDWSWTPAFLDVDLDGWPDLLVSAGQERGSRDLDLAEHMKAFRRAGLRTDAQIFRERQKFPPQRAPLRAFWNRGTRDDDGVPVFEDAGATWGFDLVGVSHGLALGDLDGDGDLDVVVNHLNAPAGLYRNESAAPRLSVRLQGRAPNTDAIGARLRFWWRPDKGVARPQSVQVTAGGRYLSGDACSKTFACPGPGEGTLEIRWPSGAITTEFGLAANQAYEIQESALPSAKAPAPVPKMRLRFEARPTGLRSTASAYDDFTVQPLLPRRQSTRLPAMGFRRSPSGAGELWLGGGPGQSLRQVTLAATVAENAREFGPPRASAAVVGWGDGAVVAESAWQGNGEANAGVFRVSTSSGKTEPLVCTVSAPTCLALSAIAPMQGALLFVGSGATPGQFPRTSPSELLRFDGASFRSLLTTNLGLVTAARFADLDADGRAELIAVSEWGTPRIFRWSEAGLVGWDAPVSLKESPAVSLGALTGWWQSLAVGDFDRDGRPDLVLGNWGLNSAYALYTGSPSKANESLRPLVLCAGTVGDGGPLACLEAYTGVDGRVRPIHGLPELAAHLPGLAARFPTHRAFAEATLEGVLGQELRGVQRLECRWLSSLLLLNRGDHFEARPLPDAAQLGPIMALAVADFDGDGHADLYAAQGFFGHNFGVIREDGGEGVFLLNRPGGSFESVPSSETGVRLIGEQRAALAEDLDGDGRADLILGEHGGPVTILLNRRP